MKRAVWILFIVLVAFSTLSGCWNGWLDWQRSEGFGEKIVAALNFGYGIAGAISILALLLRSRFAFWTIFLWATLTFACAILAVIVFTPADHVWGALLPAVGGLLAVFVPVLFFVHKNLPATNKV